MIAHVREQYDYFKHGKIRIILLKIALGLLLLLLSFYLSLITESVAIIRKNTKFAFFSNSAPCACAVTLRGWNTSLITTPPNNEFGGAWLVFLLIIILKVSIFVFLSLSLSLSLMDYIFRKGKTARKMRSLFNGSLISRSKKGKSEGGQKDRALEAIEVPRKKF